MKKLNLHDWLREVHGSIHDAVEDETVDWEDILVHWGDDV